VIENCTLVSRSAFSPRSVSRIFICCSVDSAAGATDFVSPAAAPGAAPLLGDCEGCAALPCPVVSGLAPTGFSGACAAGAGFALSGAALSGACALGAGFALSGAALSGACALGAGFALSGAALSGACALGAGLEGPGGKTTGG
jgi:hypothetical protein